MVSLDESTAQTIQGILDEKTNATDGLVGSVFAAIRPDGSSLFKGASGVRQFESSEKLSTNAVFWLASLTKCVTSMAALQLIEQGKLQLDQEIASILPELANLSIVAEDGTVTAQSKTPITLKMLLTHTSGLSYTFVHSGVKQHVDPTGSVNEFAGKLEGFKQPLVSEPGTRWNYSSGIDWVGLLVERVSGQKLEQYFQEHIFKPLGIKDLTFEISRRPDMLERLAGMNKRDAEGKLSKREHLPLHKGGQVYSGGGGLFGTAEEYLKILAVWLNNGAGINGSRILQASSVDLAFTNQIADLSATMDDAFGMSHPTPELSGPSPGGLPKWSPEDKRGWGLGFCTTENELVTGRGKNSVWWAGLPNLYYWVDRTKGVAGVFCNQILPMGDLPVFLTWMAIEGELYKGLQA